MISVSTKVERASTHEAFKIVMDGVSWHWSVENILQGTTGTRQKKGSLIHDFNELANNVPILAESGDVEPL
jgi:hypothetical protein